MSSGIKAHWYINVSPSVFIECIHCRFWWLSSIAHSRRPFFCRPFSCSFVLYNINYYLKRRRRLVRPLYRQPVYLDYTTHYPDLLPNTLYSRVGSKATLNQTRTRFFHDYTGKFINVNTSSCIRVQRILSAIMRHRSSFGGVRRRKCASLVNVLVSILVRGWLEQTVDRRVGGAQEEEKTPIGRVVGWLGGGMDKILATKGLLLPGPRKRLLFLSIPLSPPPPPVSGFPARRVPLIRSRSPAATSRALSIRLSFVTPLAPFFTSLSFAIYVYIYTYCIPQDRQHKQSCSCFRIRINGRVG